MIQFIRLQQLRTIPLFFWTAGYLAAHLFLYLFFFRHWKAFFREKVIFFYHAVSFSTVTAFFLFIGRDLEVFMAAVSLHGIYSLTFLEFWSLSAGGYSLRILDFLDGAPARGKQAPDMTSLQNLGQSKKQNRIRSLVKTGLVGKRNGKFFLTGAGKAFVIFLAWIVWPSNPKKVAP